MEAWNVYTVGGIEYISQVLKGIVMIFGENSFQSLVRAFMVWGLFIASFRLISPDGLQRFFGQMLVMFIAFNMFFAVKKDVTIIDTKHDQTYVVSSVPLGPALVAYIASTTSYYITGKLDSLFHSGTVNVWTAEGGTQQTYTSSSLDYRSTGYAGMTEYIDLLKKIHFDKIATTEMRDFTSMLDTFLYQCTWNEISVMKQKDIEDTFNNATDLMAALKPGANQYMTYNGSLTTCVDFYKDKLSPKYDEVKKEIDPSSDKSESIYALLGLKQKDKDAAPNVISEVLQGSVDLTNMITQAGLAHAYFQAGLRYTAGMKPNSSEVALMYETGRNKEEAKQMGKSLGLYAKEIIPYLKVALEALLLALSPIVALLILIPGNIRLLKGYVESLVVIYLWDPILAVLNGIINISAISKVQTQLSGLAASGVSTDALTINTIISMLETMDYIPAVAGYLAISVPSLALGLLKGGEITMANLASMMAQPVMSSPPHQEAMHDASRLSMEQKTGISMGKQLSADQAFMAMDLTRKAMQVQKHGVDTLYGAHVGGAEYELAGKMAQSEKFGELGMDTLKTGFQGGITSSTAAGIAAEGKGISAMSGYQKDKLDLDMAGTEGTKQGVGGDMGKYTDMKKLETQRTYGDVKGEEKAANTLGLDIGQYKQFVSEVRGLQGYSDAAQYDNAMTQLSEKFGMTKADGYKAVATLNASKTVGAIEKIREQGFSEKVFGELQGGLDTLNTLKTSAQVNAVGEGVYLDTARDSMISEATKWQNLREYASSKGVGFEGLVSSMNRQGQFALDAEMAKKLGVGGRAGSYSLSWDESGKEVWTEGKGGHDIRQKDVDLVEVQKGTQIWEGYEKTVRNITQGDVILGNSKSDMALVSAHNQAVEQRIEGMRKENPSLDDAYVQRLREKLTLQQGDHVTYQMDKDSGRMSTWSVSRSGKTVTELSAQKTLGSETTHSQDHTHYKGGTRSEGVSSAMAAETARKLGADEQTAQAWSDRIGAFHGLLDEVSTVRMVRK